MHGLESTEMKTYGGVDKVNFPSITYIHLESPLSGDAYCDVICAVFAGRFCHPALV